VPVLQAQSPEFKPIIAQKKKVTINRLLEKLSYTLQTSSGKL
jgi:hypothetical protein